MTDVFIGNYRIIKKIGAGGQAKVYLAVHKDVPNLRVILKILSDSTLADRFKQEADKLALLDGHPSICRIKHFFNEGDELVIAMEYIEGDTLDQLIADAGQVPPNEALILMKKLLSVLEFAHEREIFHRDIKPSNVMVANTGEIKVIDFGIAKSKSDPNLTLAGSACGTPAYMAPEQFTPSDDTDYQLVDIYAVGVTMYYMLTGQLPFQAENEFVMRDKKLFSDPPKPRDLNPKLSADLESLVLKALNKDPELRFQSVKEMRLAVEGLIDSRPKQAVEELATQSISTGKVVVPKSGGRGFRSAAIGVAAVVVVAVGAYFVWFRGGDDTVPRPPVAVAPAPGSVFSQSSTPTIRWRPQTPGTFVLEYADNANFANGHTIASPGDSVYTFSNDLANGTYYWRVWLNGPQGPLNHSSVNSFVIDVAADEGSTPAPGLLTLTIEPPADLVVIDDSLEFRNRQKTLSIPLSEGAHVVVLTNDRSNEKRIIDTIEIRSEESASRTFHFTMPPPINSTEKLGELRIGSSPKGATIIIDGEEQQYKTNFAFRLSGGQHIVTARIDISGTEVSKTDTVVVKPGGAERLYFEFE